MNLEELKKLINPEGKVVIIEDGKPVMVILSYEDYKERKKYKGEKLDSTEKPSENEKSGRELTLDDLPF